jgi:hypothetical protein
MPIGARTLARTISLLLAVSLHSVAVGEEPASSSSPSEDTSTENQATDQTAAATPAPGFWKRETFTGDWGGT